MTGFRCSLRRAAILSLLMVVAACGAEPDPLRTAKVEALSAVSPSGVSGSAGQQVPHLCLSCHGAEGGPSRAPPFATISQRYSASGDAAAVLSESLKNGSHGKWTQARGAAMPAQTQLSQGEKKAIVQWILAQ